jgi:pimeloyl-ACP methyl ester carboxylesterase
MTDICSPRKLDPNERHFRIPGPCDGLSLFLRLLAARAGVEPRGAVLYVHGATFPRTSRRCCRARISTRGAKAISTATPKAARAIPSGSRRRSDRSARSSRRGHGQLAYDPSRIAAPVAIIRGEWDNLMRDDDARWLFDALTQAPLKRDIKIGRGTHLMHLEAMRPALWQESVGFLRGDDAAPVP